MNVTKFIENSVVEYVTQNEMLITIKQSPKHTKHFNGLLNLMFIVL